MLSVVEQDVAGDAVKMLEALGKSTEPEAMTLEGRDAAMLKPVWPKSAIAWTLAQSP